MFSTSCFQCTINMTNDPWQIFVTLFSLWHVLSRFLFHSNLSFCVFSSDSSQTNNGPFLILQSGLDHRHGYAHIVLTCTLVCLLHGTTLHNTCIALNYTALHQTILCCTKVHCTTPSYTVLYQTTLCCTALNFTAVHCTVLHQIILHCTKLHYIILHCMALHCTLTYI